jgi:hypothetical protein
MVSFPLLYIYTRILNDLHSIIRRMKNYSINDQNKVILKSKVFQDLVQQGIVVPPDYYGEIEAMNLEWDSENSIPDTLEEIRQDRV